MMTLNFETERLLIRQFQADDWLDLYEMLSDEETVRYQPYRPLSLGQAHSETTRRMASSSYLAVELKSENKLIGSIYLETRGFETMELGYVFNRRYWKKGFACEALKELLEEVFSRYRIHRIFARCNPENEGSWHLLEKLGFLREGHFKKDICFTLDENNQPVWQDSYVYSLINPYDLT